MFIHAGWGKAPNLISTKFSHYNIMVVDLWDISTDYGNPNVTKLSKFKLKYANVG